ncbi:MAG: M23 family metallopeptidase [Candidatus Carbobacillus altaicus]|nr:M23 family metallopeptidase [Candidatus Carbobacillus altaicus]
MDKHEQNTRHDHVHTEADALGTKQDSHSADARQSDPESKSGEKSVGGGSQWGTRIKRLIAQKWFFPAVYLGAAALILSFIVWYQGSNPYTYDKDGNLPIVQDEKQGPDVSVAPEEDAVPVTQQEESWMWPVEATTTVKIARPFYDESASTEEQTRSLIRYANSYYPNTGIDVSIDGKTPFDVVAAKSGTVERAEVDPVVGGVVWIAHDDGTMSVYESLTDLSVSEGMVVKQGQRLGTAGKNAFDQDLGVHLHFELQKDGQAVNPLTLLPSLN